jgi:hypothetical protein
VNEKQDVEVARVFCFGSLQRGHFCGGLVSVEESVFKIVVEQWGPKLWTKWNPIIVQYSYYRGLL